MPDFTETIHIFYACDDNFAKFTMVSIASLMENASKGFKYHIHILHSNIGEENQKRTLAMQKPPFHITFNCVNDYLESVSGTLPLRDYYSNTTYFRLFIAEMFPELKKAIYIDSDTIVTGDISKMYAYNVDNYDLAACHEQAMVQVDEYGTYVEKCMGINRNAYFNAGILLINCRRFREKKVLEKFMNMLGVYNFRVTQDEDYLNLICKDHVLFLPQIYNTEIFGELLDPIEDCCILHYIMTSKPWHYTDCRHGDIFWKYAEKTEVYGEIKKILDTYTDEERRRDAVSGEKLLALAIEETNRPDNYLNRLTANRDAGRVAILKKIEEFEKRGNFLEDVEDDPPTRPIEKGEVDYLRKNPINRMHRTVAFAMAHRFVKEQIDKKNLIIREIRGIENFAALESGAVITCNHFNAFDSFAMELAYEASGQKKNRRGFYRVIKEGNYTSFPGFYGYLMRHCNTIPLASAPSAKKEMVKATFSLLKDGNFVLVYPEQSMWWNYRKPKPLQPGGYYFAAKTRVPVLPCFITMRDSEYIGEDGFPVQEYTVHVAPPIYPEKGRSLGENTETLMQKNAEIWKEIYEREYGMPLTYTTEEAVASEEAAGV